MNFLVIDGAQDKINFFSNFNNNSYHKTIKASKDNNEKLKALEDINSYILEMEKFYKKDN